VSDNDHPPELSDEWDDLPTGEAPWHKRARFLRLIGIIALASLVLPGVLVTWTTSRQAAKIACEIAVSYYAPAADASVARFELLPLDTLGWNCHAVMADGVTIKVASLGPIPGQPTLRPLTGS
jgi:hypothetical protein